MPGPYNWIVYEQRGHIGHIRMNRPEKLNSYHNGMLYEMLECWTEIRDNDDIWVAVLSAEGRAYCAGHDISGEPDPQPGPEPVSIHYGTFDLFKPIVTACQGYALGGGASLALGCDIRIVSEDFRLGYPQPSYGGMSLGGPQRLPRMTHWGKAMEWLLTASQIPADECLRWGLVNKVVPNGKQLETAFEFVEEKILVNAPIPIRLFKEAAVRGIRQTYLAEAIQVGMLVAAKNRDTEDSKEGGKARRERRKAVWTGR